MANGPEQCYRELLRVLLLQSAPFLTVGMTVEDNSTARVYSDNDMVLVSYVRASHCQYAPKLARVCASGASTHS